MSKRTKMTLEFEGLEDYAKRLEKAAGDMALRQAVEEALKKSAEHVNGKLHEGMKRHHKTGKTEASIVDNAPVVWEGMTAKIDVGLDIAHGGLPSIFLMYGTPKMPKDSKLYADIYGSRVKREVSELQAEIFKKHMKEAMGG